MMSAYLNGGENPPVFQSPLQVEEVFLLYVTHLFLWMKNLHYSDRKGQDHPPDGIATLI